MGSGQELPDLFLTLPLGGYTGLWMEIKSSTGILSLAQIKWMNKLICEGCAVALCNGFLAAKTYIEEYIK